MKIERNIPMPEAPKAAPKVRVPVESMEIGDSIFFAGVSRNSALGKVRGTAMRAQLRHNYKTAVEADGVRVWRIS